MKKIVIVGGGAGGLELATQLGHKLSKKGKADVHLVDRELTHVWKPLLHDVATGSFDIGMDAVSYRAHARKHHFHFSLGSVCGVDRQAKQIIIKALKGRKGGFVLGERRIDYDILVMALGSVSNDFGTEGVAEHCIYLDKVAQAERFHQQLLDVFLKFKYEKTESETLNISIVGAGATGVELSAGLHNVVQDLAEFGFPEIRRERLRVTLIEAGETILPALPKRISEAAHNELTKLGVDVKIKTRVVKAEEEGLVTADGNKIPAHMMVWAAGIKVLEFLSDIEGLETNRINQLVVNRTLQTTQDETIYAIGDCAACELADGRKVPPRAQSAHQMASLAMKNIIAQLNDRALKDYEYKDYGSLVTLSKYSTVGSLMGNLTSGSLFIEGRIARVVYMSLYRMHQVAVHGRAKTFLIMLVDRLNKAIHPTIKLH